MPSISNQMRKVAFTTALREMARASSNAKANDWGVEPHFDMMTDRLFIVYAFDSRREATSMSTQLGEGRVFVIPTEWKRIVNERHKAVIFAKGKYYGVYDATLQIDSSDLECTPHMLTEEFTLPHPC